MAAQNNAIWECLRCEICFSDFQTFSAHECPKTANTEIVADHCRYCFMKLDRNSIIDSRNVISTNQQVMNSSQVFSIGAGRGRVINKPIKLRRPGQFEAKQQSEHMKQIETLLNELTLVGLEDKSIYTLIGKIKVHCDSGSDVELLVNLVYKFCTESADNAKIGAILSYHLGDFSAEDKKFRTELLRKIQHDFGERNIVFAQTEKFVQNIIIICELFQYLRLMNGEKIVVLINPIAEYLEMLLRNKTNLEIETFAEQIQKCHKEIKQHQPEKFENLLMKIRTTIITSPSESTRALLLQVFEQILLGGEEMNSKLFEFYEQHCIQGKIVD